MINVFSLSTCFSQNPLYVLVRAVMMYIKHFDIVFILMKLQVLNYLYKKP